MAAEEEGHTLETAVVEVDDVVGSTAAYEDLRDAIFDQFNESRRSVLSARFLKKF